MHKREREKEREREREREGEREREKERERQRQEEAIYDKMEQKDRVWGGGGTLTVINLIINHQRAEAAQLSSEREKDRKTAAGGPSAGMEIDSLRTFLPPQLTYGGCFRTFSMRN